jgi:hypothetical protein
MRCIACLEFVISTAYVKDSHKSKSALHAHSYYVQDSCRISKNTMCESLFLGYAIPTYGGGVKFESFGMSSVLWMYVVSKDEA